MRTARLRYGLRRHEFARTMRGLALDIKQRVLQGFGGACAPGNVCEMLRMLHNAELVGVRLEFALGFRRLPIVGHVLPRTSGDNGRFCFTP